MSAGNESSNHLAPVVTLKWEPDGGGTYRAVMTVSGLQTESQAQIAMQMMQEAFCADEIEIDQ